MTEKFLPLENIPFYLLVIALTLSMATYTWQLRNSPGAKPQVYLQLCKAFWLLSLVMTSTSIQLEDKLFYRKLTQILSEIAPYLFFLMITEASQQQKIIPKVIKRGFLAITGLQILVTLFDSWLGLFWQEIWLEGRLVQVFQKPGQLVALLCAYLICVITLALGVRWIITTAGLRRRQALWFTFASLFTLIGTILNLVPAARFIAPLPLGSMLTTLFMTWGFHRWQTYNVLPVAQKVAIRNMIDGLLVVDEYGYIVDMNGVAKDALVGLPASIGNKFEELAAAWPALAAVDKFFDQQTMEAFREHPTGNRYYQLQLTPLQTDGGYLLGKIILLQDITQQKQDHEKMLEQEKALSILTERNRLGRELHDGQGQIWSSLKLQYQTLRELVAGKRLAEADLCIEMLIEMCNGFHTDIRESIVGLKNSTAPERGLLPTLQEYLTWYEKNYAIAAHLTVSPEMTLQLSPTAELQLLRIIQETLTNTRKHAKASSVRVVFQSCCEQGTVVIEDDGCGFDLQEVPGAGENHHGLTIMQERAGEIGGRLEIQSAPGTGTKVTIWLPEGKGVYNHEAIASR